MAAMPVPCDGLAVPLPVQAARQGATGFDDDQQVDVGGRAGLTARPRTKRYQPYQIGPEQRCSSLNGQVGRGQSRHRPRRQRELHAAVLVERHIRGLRCGAQRGVKARLDTQDKAARGW